MKHIVKNLVKIANELDANGLHPHASQLDQIISRLASSTAFSKAAEAFSKKVFERSDYTMIEDLQAAATMQRDDLEYLARRCSAATSGKELANDIAQAALDFDAFIKEQRKSRNKSVDPKQEDELIKDNVDLIKLIFVLSDAARS